MTPEDIAKSGSEFGEQAALFVWCNLAATRKRFPQFYRDPAPGEKLGRCKLYSINNNAGVGAGEDAKKTAAIRGARAKQIGLVPGVADIFLPMARRGFHGLYIEMKIDEQHPENLKCKKKGLQSPVQVIFQKQVESDRYAYALCKGWKEAVAAIEWYLEK